MVQAVGRRFSLLRTAFNAMPVHVGFVVNKVAPGHVFLRVQYNPDHAIFLCPTCRVVRTLYYANFGKSIIHDIIIIII